MVLQVCVHAMHRFHEAGRCLSVKASSQTSTDFTSAAAADTASGHGHSPIYTECSDNVLTKQKGYRSSESWKIAQF